MPKATSFPFPCHECRVVVDCPMVWHYESSHAAMKSFRCGSLGCHKTFKSVYALKRHYQLNHHNEGKPNPNVKVSDTLDLDDETCPDEEMLTEEDSSSDNELLLDLDSIIDIDAVKESSLLFVGNLLSAHNMPIKYAFEVVEGVSKLYGPLFSWLRLFSEKIESPHKQSLKKAISAFEDPFSGINSEYLLLKELKAKNLYVEPVEHVIGTSQYTSQSGGLKQISQKASYVPLGQMLTKSTLLSLPGVITDLKAHMSAKR